MDYVQLIKNVMIGWKADSQTKALMVKLFLLSVIFSLLSSVAMFFLIPNYFDLFLNIGDLQTSTKFMAALFANIIPVIATIGFLTTISLLIRFYLSIKLKIRALQINGFETGSLNLVKILKLLILLPIWSSIVIMTSVYHKKLKFYFVALVLGGILVAILVLINISQSITVLLVLLWVLLLIPYHFVIIYNSIRLSILAESVFLNKDLGVIAATKEAWQVGEGNVLKLLLSSSILILIILFVGFALWVIQFVISLMFGFVTAVFSPFVFVNAIFSLIYSALFFALFGVWGAFFNPSIYAQLKNQPQPVASTQPASVQSAQSDYVSRRQSRMSAGLSVEKVLAEKTYSPSKPAKSNTEHPLPSETISQQNPGLTRRDQRYVENLVKALSGTADKYSKKDLVKVMQEKGYSQPVIDETLKRLGK